MKLSNEVTTPLNYSTAMVTSQKICQSQTQSFKTMLLSQTWKYFYKNLSSVQFR